MKTVHLAITLLLVTVAFSSCNDNATETNNASNIGFVQIGNQKWMAKNLDITTYRNGDPIRYAPLASEWVDAGSKGEGAYCIFESKTALATTYGLIYNWYAVNDPRGLAPQGWHVPSDEEWTSLEVYLGGVGAGGKLKATGTREAGSGLWNSPNLGATNETRFSALPGGFRNLVGTPYAIYLGSYFWTSTKFNSVLSWYRLLNSADANITKNSSSPILGCYVRCVKD